MGSEMCIRDSHSRLETQSLMLGKFFSAVRLSQKSMCSPSNSSRPSMKKQNLQETRACVDKASRTERSSGSVHGG